MKLIEWLKKPVVISYGIFGTVVYQDMKRYEAILTHPAIVIIGPLFALSFLIVISWIL